MRLNHIAQFDPNQKDGPRSIERFVEPLRALPALRYEPLGSFGSGSQAYCVSRFDFRGGKSSDPIRIALFGGIHGDEPVGPLALAEFLRILVNEPALSENFHLQIYPICNPTGFEDNTRNSRSGRDLNREFWKNSSEAEVQILERELRSSHFNGIVQLHSDDTTDGIYGFVRGHTLTENLLRPALRAAGQILPRNINATIDGFAARDGIIYDLYEGVLAAPAQMDPVPFEIILETPQKAAMELQVQAMIVALRTILEEYRRLMAFAANI
ncbi:MAG: hypothetical protein C5B50_13220 [Verrucomicrobia bacterium]|nr:MAG: hypothetical protein C5B50_13220 [Verrucomicrobiota bacterium]